MLILTPESMAVMRAEVERAVPLEACGLLAGLGNRVLAALPVSNSLNSPVAYRMDPQEQLRAFREIESRGWEMLAIYHSHPHGPDHPSPTDIAQAYYPDTPYLIWFPDETDWRCRGYTIRDGKVTEIRLKVEQA